jgi:hypothetical protein
VPDRRPIDPLRPPGDRIEEVERPLPGERFVYLDNLKALLIAGIIAAHGLIGYADLGSWSYQDIREVTLSPVVETVFEVAFLSLGGLFLMALFFLISGLLTEDSLARHGLRASSTIASYGWACPSPSTRSCRGRSSSSRCSSRTCIAARTGTTSGTPTRCSTTGRCGSSGSS